MVVSLDLWFTWDGVASLMWPQNNKKTNKLTVHLLVQERCEPSLHFDTFRVHGLAHKIGLLPYLIGSSTCHCCHQFLNFEKFVPFISFQFSQQILVFIPDAGRTARNGSVGYILSMHASHTAPYTASHCIHGMCPKYWVCVHVCVHDDLMFCWLRT